MEVTPFSVLRSWWKTWRSLPVWSWLVAASAYRAGDFERARKLYLRGLQGKPNHPARFCAYLDLAYCEFKLGMLAEAREHLQYVCNLAPHCREAHIRLARLNLWVGRPLEATRVIRRAFLYLQPDVETVSTFLLAAFENGGPSSLIREGLDLIEKLKLTDLDHRKLLVAKICDEVRRGNRAYALNKLERIVNKKGAPFEAVVVLSELLLEDRNVSEARRYLTRALAVAPSCPRVLNLFAELYLRTSVLYNPEYARQLATQACQTSAWMSPRAIHTLARSYFHLGDSASALMLATKAKNIGDEQRGYYLDQEALDQFITELNSSPQHGAS